MTQEAMDIFRQAAESPYNIHAKDFKERNSPVVGYLCGYIPVELIHAAGALPYRIKGIIGKDSGRGTEYLSSRLCTFTRNALSAALDGDFAFLDGFIGSNSCDQVRRTSQNWSILKPSGFDMFIDIPRVLREVNIEKFSESIETMRNTLESVLGITLTDERIADSIRKFDEARGLLRELSSLRASSNISITGEEMLTVSIAFQQMPVEVFIEAAEELLEIRKKEGGTPSRTRVMVCGGMLDDPEYIKFIEEAGLDVVADPVCYGMRCYMDDTGTGADPVKCLASRYIKRFPCARIGESFQERWERLLGIYKDFKIDGMIYQRLKFCQLWGVDMHNMARLCDEEQIPLLSLEREYGFISSGQLKTRLQAFSELIESRKSKAF